MFFRRNKKFASPIKGDDGYYYAEEGQEYDSEEYETDSDYSSEERGSSGSDDKSDNKSLDDAEQNMNGKTELDKSNEMESVTSDVHENECGHGIASLSSIVNEKMIPSQASTINDTEKNIDGEVHFDDNTSNNGNEVSEGNAKDDTNRVQVLKTTDSIGYGARTDDNDETNVATLGQNIVVKNDDELEEPITLKEKRALIALAAQHDRVDILKSILQPSPNSRDCVALAQLLLNNVIIDQGEKYTADDLEDVFLPPLHIAIISSSTNAASCLLRMGSDPSIRPEIPEDWEGPGWTDENGEVIIDQDIWTKFHGMSAWELAFGTLRRMNANETKAVKRGWFGFRSSSSKGDEKVPELYVTVKIEHSKLEGIRHAFTAEALRAIGSDEVGRLKQLLDSGLGHLEPIEIGGKDLCRWCLEMGAKKCVEILKSYSTGSTGDSTECSTDEGKISEIEKDQESHVDKQFHDEFTLEELQNKLEEMRSLETALSSMLDNLAEEVSVTQGLLMQHGDDSNSALISQVRQLKKQRAEIDDEISQWAGYVADRRAELDMVSIWWQKRGGALDDIQNIDEPPTENTEPLPDVASYEYLEEQVRSCKEKLDQSENKVKKLRNSISNLSKESLQNLQEVESLGLLGAVKLTRKLKDEVREQKDVLESLIKEEESVKNKVKWIRHLLESSDASMMHASPDSYHAKDKITANGISEDQNQSNQPLETCESVDSDSERSSDDDDDRNNDSDGSSDSSKVKYESHSESIRRGHSTAIVEWVDDGDLGIFTFKIWALFQRLVGPSTGYPIEESALEHDDTMDSPRVIII